MSEPFYCKKSLTFEQVFEIEYGTENSGFTTIGLNAFLDELFDDIAPGESRIRSYNLPPDSTGNPIFYHLKDNLTYRIPRRVLSPIEVPDGY